MERKRPYDIVVHSLTATTEINPLIFAHNCIIITIIIIIIIIFS
jgi:hypothetical protein